MTANLMGTSLQEVAPQIPSFEAAKLAEQVAPNADEWQSKVIEQQAIIDAKTAEIESLKAKLAAQEKAETKQKTPTSSSKSKQEVSSGWKSGEFTAYYPANDAMQGGGITAKGDNLYTSIYYQGYRIIAAPPSVPFNTIVEIQVGGQTIKGIVRDRGGRIQGNNFDITFPNLKNCQIFGRQQGKWRVIQ